MTDLHFRFERANSVKNAIRAIARPPRPSATLLRTSSARQRQMLQEDIPMVLTSMPHLEGTASGGVPTAGVGAHARKASYSEDMRPPSERLLRTIIDSVPCKPPLPSLTLVSFHG